ncbi:MAG: polysaccharide biosynthesis/export family protein [Bacillota bacterium]
MRCRQMVGTWGRTSRGVALAAGMLVSLLGGCNSFLDQSEVTRGPKSGRLVVPVLSSIDPLDEANPEFSNAEDVKPEDMKVIPTDYVIGRNDLLTVSVYDLVNQGVETVRSVRVSETGMLSLPLLAEPLAVAGMTEAQLQKSIVQKYKEANLLPNAQVAVTVNEARQRTFWITGSVMRPQQYSMVEADFRLLQALTTAGGATFPTEYLYVIRKRSSEKPTTQPVLDPKLVMPQQQPTTEPTDLAPRAQGPATVRPVLALADEPAAKAQPAAEQAAGNEERFGTVEGKAVLIGADKPKAQEAAAGAEVPATQAVDTVATSATQPAYEFGSTLKADEDQRIIRVPLQALQNGDLRYNIVIRPNDLVYVPVPQTGVYYMGGHVAAPGAFNLAGQKMTLMQAIISARGLDQLAVPSRTDVVRRVGEDKQLFVRVDLGEIFAGTQPDIFLKPNDIVTVGTDIYPSFLAALRGAFRITYGFGFLYDRNYAPAQTTRYESN